MKPILLIGFLAFVMGISAIDSGGYRPALLMIVGMVLMYKGAKDYEED